MAVTFKKGMYELNAQSNFNYQLNRLVMWDGGDLEEIKKVGLTIHTSEDWKTKLISLGNKAMAEQRTENAIAYYRMSEFFMYDGDPDKKKYYKKGTELFYDYYKEWFESGRVERTGALRRGKVAGYACEASYGGRHAGKRSSPEGCHSVARRQRQLL